MKGNDCVSKLCVCVCEREREREREREGGREGGRERELLSDKVTRCSLDQV